MKTDPLKILAIDIPPDELAHLHATVGDALPGSVIFPAQNADQATRLALAEEPDVILLDGGAAAREGYATCRRLKSDEQTRHIPVVCLAQAQTDPDDRQALEAGADAVLARPLEKAEVRAELRAMAKIKQANLRARQEQEWLLQQVAERTAKLEEELAERVQVETALRESSAALDLILNTVPQAIFWKDTGGRYLGCNRHFAAVVGLDDPSQVIGKTDYEFPFVSEYVEAYQADDRAVMESGRPKLNIIEPLHRADGSLHWLETSKIPLTDAAGNTTGVLGLFDDITDLKTAEKALDNFFDQPMNMHLITTLDGVIRRANQGWQVYLGYTREELEGTPYLRLVHPEDQAATLHEASKVAEGETTFGFTNRYRHKNGVYRLLVWSAIASVEDGLIYAVAMDTTEQEEVKQRLVRERTHLAGVIQGANVGTWEWNVQSGATVFNDKWAEIVGYTLDELAPVSIKTWETLAHPEDLAKPGELLQQHFAGEVSYYDLEWRMRHKNGAWVWVRDRGQVISWTEDGKPLMMFGTHMDITKRKQAEIALRQSHEMLARLTEQVPGVVYQYRLYPDGHSCFPYSSPGMMEIYEYTPEDVREDATPVFGRLHPDDVEGVSAAIFASARTLQLFHCEFRVILPRQGLRWRMSDAKPERLPDGSTLWYGIITDITERKQTEDEIKNRENRFHALIKNGRDNISLLAADGTLLWESPSHNRTLGYTPDKFVGHNIFELMHPDDQAWTSNLYAQVVQSPGSIQEGEFRLLHADDSWRWIECSATNLLHEPNIQAIVLNYRDVTRRKQTETALHESEARYRILADDLPALICEYLPDSTLTYVNQAYAHYFGFSMEELVGRPFLDLIPEETRQASKDVYLSLTPEEPMKVTSQMVIIDNRICWQEWHDRAIFDATGKATHYRAIGFDVTERHRAESMRRMRLELLEFSTSHSLQEVQVKTLDMVGELTDSPVGFYHLVGSDEETLLLQAWSTRTSQEFCQNEGEGMHNTLSQAGIWADSVRLGKVVVHNDYATTPNRRGMPEDHAHIVRELVVPLFRAGKVKAILGIGNKSVDYTEDDVEIATYFADVAWEITNRMLGEAAVQESEASLRKAQEVANVGSWVWHIQNNRLEWSEQMYRIFGVKRDEFTGDLTDIIARCIHPDDRPAVENSNRSVMFEAKPLPLEYRIIRPDGVQRVVWAEARELVRDDAGQPAILIGIVQDITERVEAQKQREQLLAQVQAQSVQIAQIMDTVPEGVLLVSADGLVLLANPTGKKDLRRLADAAVGHTITHLGTLPLADLLTASAHMWREVTVGLRIFEVIARSVSPLSTGADKPADEHWVVVINDVTQARNIRDQLEQQERLAAVGQLAAGIAHDFNNILAVIALHAPMLAQASGLNERDRERLTVIREQTAHAAQLIQQILDFSRRAVLQRQPIDLSPFLKEQGKLLMRTLPEAIRVVVTCEPGAHVVLADLTRMRQMVMNLAVNARDAMPDGGTLRLGLSRRDPPPRPDLPAGPWVCLEVADSGTGMSPEAQLHLFEPFFTTKPVGRGTGLGLAQVHGIVKQHQGEISVSSIAGEGTTFHIYLPAATENASAPPSESKPQSGGGETILIVEDNPALLDALSDIVEMLGYEPICASNGAEALAVLEKRAQQIDLVLSDLSMPVMGGEALLDAMQERGLRIPVVILSGYSLDGTIDRLKRKGVMGWLLKPPSVEKLSALLSQVLAG